MIYIWLKAAVARLNFR